MSIIGFPLLLIPFAIVNIIAFLMPGVSLGAPLYTVPLVSGVGWTITFADALIAFAILLLFFEVAKNVRPGGKYLTDHLLSFLVFAGATAEFVLLPRFGNSTFFLLTVLSFVEVISGITIKVRQRGAMPARVSAARSPRAEPSLDPAPVVPAAQISPVPEVSPDQGVLELEKSAISHEAPSHEPERAEAHHLVDESDQAPRG